MNYEIVKHQDYSRLGRRSRATATINELLTEHSINLDDYHIVKATSKFKFIEAYELLKHKYCLILLINRKVYDEKTIQEFLNFLNNLKANVLFLNNTNIIKHYKKLNITNEL